MPNDREVADEILDLLLFVGEEWSVFDVFIVDLGDVRNDLWNFDFRVDQKSKPFFRPIEVELNCTKFDNLIFISVEASRL